MLVVWPHTKRQAPAVGSRVLITVRRFAPEFCHIFVLFMTGLACESRNFSVLCQNLSQRLVRRASPPPLIAASQGSSCPFAVCSWLRCGGGRGAALRGRAVRLLWLVLWRRPPSALGDEGATRLSQMSARLQRRVPLLSAVARRVPSPAAALRKHLAHRGNTNKVERLNRRGGRCQSDLLKAPLKKTNKQSIVDHSTPVWTVLSLYFGVLR